MPSFRCVSNWRTFDTRFVDRKFFKNFSKILNCKGKFALTYEAAVTLLFKDGRTETIRPCSESVVEFVELFEQKGDKKETVAALKRAMENHSRMSKEAMIGQGFDRHLFALANCAQVSQQL